MLEVKGFDVGDKRCLMLEVKGFDVGGKMS
jgi:hypothetical protein